jgi:anti-sigma factor ChrR (cupin superfamily)
MNAKDDTCGWAELVSAHAVHALTASEATAVDQHLASCERCRQEFAALRPVLAAFAAWPVDVLRPEPSLQARLAERIAAETGGQPVLPSTTQWSEPEWEDVAPGIQCKLLATDPRRHRVSMLVRLAPGGEYPPHTHAGVEELHLLAGELWIDDRKLCPGDYNRGEPGTGDQRVWSETGCTCVLVTSTKDILH